jgi:hypothetical protein
MPKKTLTADMLKKPTIAPDKRRAFIENGEAEASSKPSAGAGEGRAPERTRKKRSDAAPQKKEQLLVRLPAALIKDIKHHVTDMPKGSSISSFVEGAVRTALQSR